MFHLALTPNPYIWGKKHYHHLCTAAVSCIQPNLNCSCCCCQKSKLQPSNQKSRPRLGECWTSDWNDQLRIQAVALGCGRIFSSRLNLCWLLFGLHSPPSSLLLQWHIKDPSHSARSAGGRLQIDTHTPFTNNWVGWLCFPDSVGTCQGNKFTHNTSGNVQPQSSQLTEPKWTDPSLRCGMGVCELITTLNY